MVAVYCTFFYIYRGSILYIFIYIIYTRLMYTFLLKLMCIYIIHYYMYSLRIFYDKWTRFELLFELLRGLCVFRLCVWRSLHWQTGVYMLLTCIRGEAWPRVPPPPHRAERRLGYPQANFFYFSKQIFYFFLPHPITSSIYPFSFPLRGFLFLCVYFPIRVSFRVSEGKKRGK